MSDRPKEGLRPGAMPLGDFDGASEDPSVRRRREQAQGRWDGPLRYDPDAVGAVSAYKEILESRETKPAPEQEPGSRAAFVGGDMLSTPTPTPMTADGWWRRLLGRLFGE